MCLCLRERCALLGKSSRRSPLFASDFQDRQRNSCKAAEEKLAVCASLCGVETMGACPYCTGQQPPDVAACPVCGRNLQPAGVVTGPRRKSISLRRTVPFVIVCAIVWGLGSMLWSSVQQAREAARRSACKCNLKQLGLALHNYHEANGCFPPA